MGFFSWTCAKCEKSVLSGFAGYRKFSEAIAFFEDGTKLAGTYDGYGGMGGWSNDDRDLHEAKIVHAHCHDGEGYDDIPHSKTCPNQGFFFDRRELEQTFGDPDLSELKFSRHYCHTCDHVWTSKWATICPKCGAGEKEGEEVEPIARRAKVFKHSTCGGKIIVDYYEDEDDKPSRCSAHGCYKLVPDDLEGRDRAKKRDELQTSGTIEEVELSAEDDLIVGFKETHFIENRGAASSMGFQNDAVKVFDDGRILTIEEHCEGLKVGAYTVVDGKWLYKGSPLKGSVKTREEMMSW